MKNLVICKCVKGWAREDMPNVIARSESDEAIQRQRSQLVVKSAEDDRENQNKRRMTIDVTRQVKVKKWTATKIKDFLAVTGEIYQA